MNTQQNTKLQISLNNLDDLTQNSLKFFFNSNLCDKAELTRIDKKTNVFIIDSDRKFDENILSNLKKNNQFVIFLYNQMNNPLLEENTYNVTKPVQVKYLKQQIYFIMTRFCEIEKTEKNTRSQIINVKPIVKNKTKHASPPEFFHVFDKQKPILKHQNKQLNIALKERTESDTLSQYKDHKYVGSKKDINPNNPEELKNIFHKPKKYLYHHLVKAVKIGNANSSDILIKTLFGSLLFDYKSQLIRHQLSKTKMSYFQSSPLFLETEIVLTSISTQAKKINSVSQEPETLIWEAAIRASKGRLPLGTSLTQTIEMTSWPNYSRLLIYPYIVQISAAWSTHHMSLLDTASQLHIPQRYIFTLYNAMLAIDSAKINNVINNIRKIKSDKRKSVFSKILSHIFNH